MVIAHDWNMKYDDFMRFQEFLMEQDVTLMKTWVETPDDLPTEDNEEGDVRWVQSTGVPYIWKESQWLMIPNVGYLNPEKRGELDDQAPHAMGEIFVDVLNGNVYISTGVTSAADWTEVITAWD